MVHHLLLDCEAARTIMQTYLGQLEKMGCGSPSGKARLTLILTGGPTEETAAACAWLCGELAKLAGRHEAVV